MVLGVRDLIRIQSDISNVGGRSAVDPGNSATCILSHFPLVLSGS